MTAAEQRRTAMRGTVTTWIRRPSGPVPDPSRRSRIVDAALAAVIAGCGVAALLHADLHSASVPDLKPLLSIVKVKPDPGPIDYVCVLLAAVPLAGRRRY